MNTISNKDFKAFLTDDTANGSLQERLDKIIEEEMSKPDEEMDIELIEQCLQLAESTAEGKEQKPKKFIKTNHFVKRVAAVAAVFLLLLSINFSIKKIYIAPNKEQSIVVFDDKTTSNNSQNKNNTETNTHYSAEKELYDFYSKNGIKSVRLPTAILNSKICYKDAIFDYNDILTKSTLSFVYSNKSCQLRIERYRDAASKPAESDKACNNNEKSETLKSATGLIIYIVENDDCVTINYQDEYTSYTISTELSFEDAIIMARTIQ